MQRWHAPTTCRAKRETVFGEPRAAQLIYSLHEIPAQLSTPALHTLLALIALPALSALYSLLARDTLFVLPSTPILRTLVALQLLTTSPALPMHSNREKT